MHKIAFMIGDRFIYWSPIIITFGVLAAVCMFLALHMGHTGKATGAFVAVPLSLVLSLVLGRLAYWLCVPESYGTLMQAMTDFSTDRISLTGIVAGCALAACLVRLTWLSRDLPAMLDAMSLAGLFGLAVGRLNHLFNTADRAFSRIHLEGALEEIWPPLYLLQAAVSAALFVLLLVFFLILGRKHSGYTCLLVCFFHGAAQVVLDSTRYDALLLPGFKALTLVQIAGLSAMVLSTVLLSVQLVKNRGWKWWYLALLIPAVAALIFGIVLALQLRCEPANDMNAHYLTAGAFGIAASLVLAVCILSVKAGKKAE